MKISQIKSGMKVRISNGLKQTTLNFGVTNEMRKMRGKIYKIDGISINRKGVFVFDELGKSWTFCPEDLSPVQMTPSMTPVLFDPENILNEGK